MNLEEFKSWLEHYGRYWETGDSKKILELFSDDARYYETPFDEPLVGWQEIQRYWSEGAESAQRNVHFSFKSALVAGSRGLCHWQASFERVPSGTRVELDGYLEAEFNGQNLCIVFREWWHKKETGV